MTELPKQYKAWASLPYPTQPSQVGGHEGVGKIVKLGPGSDTSTIKVGDRVGVKWVSGTCGSCPQCMAGADALCPKAKVSGYYTPGTFQQYCLGPVNYVTPIPDELESADAAPMLCAGVTTYAALRKSKAKSGEWVVISGAGGGLGHIACQLASRGMAMRVIGIDAPAKKTVVMDCGAEHFIDVTAHDDQSIAEEVLKLTGGLGANAVVVCTASNKAYAQALDFLRFDGTVVCVGMPEGAPQPIAKSYPQALVFKQANIAAVAVGTRKDAIECLDFAARGIVKTHFRTEKMEKLTEVFQEMKDGKLIGRVVLDLQ
ncbi:alcohol dehydrogenase, propanol-preferring, partial [Lecanoromycetidae sp. Uapishka_2]